MTTPYSKNHMVILPPLAKGVAQTQQISFNLFKKFNFFDSDDDTSTKEDEMMQYCLHQKETWYVNPRKQGLRMPSEEITFTARLKINSHSQVFRYGRSIFCLPHRPNFSDIFDLCLHWLSVVRDHC